MKRNLLLLLAALLPMVTHAAPVMIDGIWYNLNTDTKQAEVTSNPDKYTGAVSIPASVTYDEMAYSVTSIGRQAFKGNKGLNSISIPESVTTIGSNAFDGCSGLTAVALGEGLTTIGDYAFYGATALTSVVIPESVTTIGRNAFYYCTALASITIPESVTSVGNEAFGVTAWLNKQPQGLIYTGKVAYKYKGAMPVGTEISIEDGTVQIASSAFYSCSGMTAITIPESVTTIDGSAFRDCTGLTSVSIPGSVSAISSFLFSGCSSLTSVSIPESVTTIGTYAFERCTSLTTVIIPSNVTNIGWYAFSGLTHLTDVWCYAEKVPITGNDTFEKSNIPFVTLHVPGISLERYKATIPWKDFGEIVSLDGPTPEPKRCATPIISYKDGKLRFNCDTDDVVFHSDITDSDITSYLTQEVELSATYTITVYASKPGHLNSDTIAATLCWIEAEPKKEGMSEDAIAEVKAQPVLIQAHDGIISVVGLEAGTEVRVYNTAGMLLDSIVSGQGVATLRTRFAKGSTVIVKIGDKTVLIHNS